MKHSTQTMPTYPLASDHDQRGDIVRFADGSLAYCYTAAGPKSSYIALHDFERRKVTLSASPLWFDPDSGQIIPRSQKHLATAAREALSTGSTANPHADLWAKWDREDREESGNATLAPPAPHVAAPPDREVLRRALLSNFRTHRDGHVFCKPLDRWHKPGVPFLAGYLTVWDTPTDMRSTGHRLVMRRGAFQEALTSGHEIEAWLGHHDDLSFASTTDGTLAIVPDSFGAAAFIDPSASKDGETIADLVADGELWGMSFAHHPVRLAMFSLGGEKFAETLAVRMLPEVSLTGNPSNRSTLTLAVNYRRPMLTSGRDAKRNYLLTKIERSRAAAVA